MTALPINSRLFSLAKKGAAYLASSIMTVENTTLAARHNQCFRSGSDQSDHVLTDC